MSECLKVYAHFEIGNASESHNKIMALLYTQGAMNIDMFSKKPAMQLDLNQELKVSYDLNSSNNTNSNITSN